MPKTTGSTRWVKFRTYVGTLVTDRRIRIGFYILAVLAIIILLLSGLLSSCQAASNTGNPLPPPVATPTVSAPPTSAPAVAPPPSSPPTSSAPSNCVSQPTNNDIPVTLKLSASDPRSIQQLRDLRGSKFTGVIYAGDRVNADQMNAWLTEAQCDGFNTQIMINSFLQTSATPDLSDLVHRAEQHAGFSGYYWSATANDDFAAFNNGKDYLLRQAGSHSTVSVFLSFEHPGDQSAELSFEKQFNADNWVLLYMPVNPPIKDYGPADYTAVGKAAVAHQGSAARAGVQAYDYGGASTGPDSATVGKFAAQLHAQGVNQVVVYTEEPAADNTPYLRACADAVAAALGR